MKLKYSQHAVNDLEHIEKYIADELKSPQAATNTISLLLHECAKLKDYPLLGLSLQERIGRETNYRFLMVRQYVDDIFVVSDGKIAKAIKTLMTAEKLVAEGAGAAPLAALLADYIPGIEKDKKVVCVISGGNIDIPLLAKLTTWELG